MMEILLSIVGIVLFLIVVEWLDDIASKFKRTINWLSFSKFLIFGVVALSIIFSFTSEGIIVIVVAGIVLVFLSLFKGLGDGDEYEDEYEDEV